MTAWYTDSTFYHMYPLGMTGAPKNNPYPWPEEAPAPVSILPSAPMEELLSWIPHLKQMNFTAVYIVLYSSPPPTAMTPGITVSLTAV